MTLTADDSRPAAGRPRFSASEGVLLGSECAACSTRSWPGRSLCHHCGSPDVAAVPLGSEGVLTTFTTVHVSRPGLAAPYVLGQLRLDDGTRLFAHVRRLAEDAATPIRVRLVFSADEQSIPPFWFEPVPS
jgi:uncharacterized protein